MYRRSKIVALTFQTEPLHPERVYLLHEMVGALYISIKKNVWIKIKIKLNVKLHSLHSEWKMYTTKTKCFSYRRQYEKKLFR